VRLLLAVLLFACAPHDDTGVTDADQDGYGSGTDCNDKDAAIHPGAEETCNHVDDDCDGRVDVDPVDGRPFYVDADGDGYGDDDEIVSQCAWSAGLTGDGGDCDDTNDEVYPGATEDDCRDTVDYNCDGYVGYTDEDLDGYPACEDCDDSDPNARPGGDEICDGRDNDCDGVPDEEGTPGAFPVWADDDADGFGDPHDARQACSLPVGFAMNDDDCDDTRWDVNPDAPEVCDDGLDDDCDGRTDTADADCQG